MVGARLKALRESKKMNQDELADKLGVSTGYISLLEADKRNLDTRLLLDILKVFNVNPADFFAEGLPKDKGVPVIAYISAYSTLISPLHHGNKTENLNLIFLVYFPF